jgi:hypothetical protein
LKRRGGKIYGDMDKYKDWIPVAGLLLTFLQTIVAIIALSSRSAQPTDTIEKRRKFRRMMAKALLFLVYSSIPVLIFCAIALNEVKPVKVLDDLPFACRIPMMLQAMWFWGVLLAAFLKTGRSVGVAVAYGMTTSTLITVTSAYGPTLLKSENVYLQAALCYTTQYAMLSVAVTFLIFSILSLRTVRQLGVEVFDDLPVHNFPETSKPPMNPPSSQD